MFLHSGVGYIRRDLHFFYKSQKRTGCKRQQKETGSRISNKKEEEKDYEED